MHNAELLLLSLFCIGASCLDNALSSRIKCLFGVLVAVRH